MPANPIVFLEKTGLFVRLEGTWPNGWTTWSIESPGPWYEASFTVTPNDDLGDLAQETAERFSQTRQVHPFLSSVLRSGGPSRQSIGT
jgi:hypothetical protein